MRIWSNSTVLLLIDSIAIAIAQGYMLARARLTSHPSPILRVTAFRDDAIMDANLLERELAVYRNPMGSPLSIVPSDRTCRFAALHFTARLKRNTTRSKAKIFEYKQMTGITHKVSRSHTPKKSKSRNVTIQTILFCSGFVAPLNL